MLNSIPVWAIALAFVALVAICGEIGFNLGTRAKATLGESPFSVLQAAVFGLLALLLAFAFSLSLSRYDSRRAEVALEANSIHTTMLRSQLLGVRANSEMQRYLQSYVDARIAFANAEIDDRKRSAATYQTEALQSQMWHLALARAAQDKRSTTLPLFIAALNDTIDQSRNEEDVLGSHIPDAVLLVLAIVIAFASVLLGVGFGRTERRGALAIAFFAIMVALVVETIVDLDRPQRGFIRVSLEPLQSLRQMDDRLNK
jgi:hypothetical protein